MAIDRLKTIEAQMDLEEIIQQNIRKVSAKTVKKTKAREVLNILQNCHKEFDANHQKLTADGRGKEDYFKRNIYEKNISECAQMIVKLQEFCQDEQSSNNEPKNEEPRQEPASEAEPMTRADIYSQLFNRKVELLRHNLKDLKIESTVSQRQVIPVKMLMAEIKNLYYDNLVQENNEVIYTTFINIQGEYDSEIGTIKKKQKIEAKDSCKLELEKIKVPPFCGGRKEWLKFQKFFKEMVHDDARLSNTEKMLRLQTYVKGEAAQIIQHLEVSQSNYDVAWGLLKDRYDNERIQFLSHWNKVLYHPMINSNCTKSVRQLLDTSKECMNAVEAMGINIRCTGPFFAQMILTKIDAEGLKLYEHSVKKTKKIQTLEDVLHFLEQQYLALEVIDEHNANIASTSSGKSPTYTKGKAKNTNTPPANNPK